MRENFACRLVSFAAVTQQLITLILSKGLREMSENPNGILTVFKFRLMKKDRCSLYSYRPDLSTLGVDSQKSGHTTKQKTIKS